jgi:hypothetical protein
MIPRHSTGALLLCLLAAFHAAVPPAGADDEAAALDPVVADVVRMLDEQVAPDVIEAWIERQEVRPGALSPDDLLALNAAGAPESLVLLLLERSEAAEDGTAAEIPGRPASTARVGFRMTYRPTTTLTHLPDEPPWGLYAYLDGQPVAFADGGTSIFGTASRPLQFERELAPGKHTLHVLLERHTLLSKKNNRWNHETRVFAEAAALEVHAGGDYDVEIEVNENTGFWSKDNGPVTIVVKRGDAVVTELGSVGSHPDEWPALCEDVEASIPEGKRPRAASRRALERCVRWSDLWSTTAGAPDRRSVRELMERYDYRPVPE